MRQRFVLSGQPVQGGLTWRQRKSLTHGVRGARAPAAVARAFPAVARAFPAVARAFPAVARAFPAVARALAAVSFTLSFTLGFMGAAAVAPSAIAGDHIGPTGTEPLTAEEDFASTMIDGIDRFLLRQIQLAAQERPARWDLDLSTPQSLQASLGPHRQRLAEALGVRDPRPSNIRPQGIAVPGDAPQIATSKDLDIYAIRWPVLHDPAPQVQSVVSLHGEGLLLVPRGKIVANVIVLPDASQTPEQLCGLEDGLPPASQVARRLAQAGCRVVVPTLISRQEEKRNNRAVLSNREYLHRAAFILGRTVAGYEVQSTLALVDWFAEEASETPIGVFGYGEGGMLALFAAGLDPRIDAACVSGFFGPRDASWQEPLDRNFAGLLQHFDAAELAMLLGGRRLIIEAAAGPQLTIAGDGAAPAMLRCPSPDAARELLEQASQRLGLPPLGSDNASFVFVDPADVALGSDEALQHLTAGWQLPARIIAAANLPPLQAAAASALPDVRQRQQRLVQQMDLYNQNLLRESEFVREQFMDKLDTRSLESFQQSQQAYREIFRKRTISDFEQPLLPVAAKSRQSWETETWTGHEVQIDVLPDVFAYGVLLLPKDLKAGEKRPVVVCQHGLEGRPTDTFGGRPAYHEYAAKLCERGFIVFAPQNPYIFKDRFRTLQRKAQPLGKSLFSVIVPQHQQIIHWLKTQPYVDGERIAFYGLSYGGKSAMRIPALVTDYCLSICSADFNEWVLKNASSRHRFSYLWTGEYEIFEWDLSSTFNYAEMAALICPRPFMVERGHFDGVGVDHWVAYEYAKVRFLYAAKLGIGERTEIEWFVGPHEINGQATFAFLHRHLDWPEPSAER